jgi:asparagine synthase (glutamine-hydrolysing)
MCGICGEIRFDGGQASATRIERMTDSMAPRGPDGAGIVLRGRVGFGHRRLRIIDLSAAGAAFRRHRARHDARLQRLHLQLPRAARRAGRPRPSLRLARRHRGDPQGLGGMGAGGVERFHGMFAFALLERDSGRVHLVRDRFGIKPLYLRRGRAALRFASTLPALLAAGGVDTTIDPSPCTIT